MYQIVVDNKKEAADFIETHNPNNTEFRYLKHVPDRIPTFPINIAYCGDERTGVRFGNAACRRNLNPIKIGGGGRNRGSISAYQIWVWDIK